MISVDPWCRHFHCRYQSISNTVFSIQYHQKPPTHVPLSYIIVESPLTFPRWFKKKSFDCGYMWEEKIPPPCHALSSPSSSSSSSPPSSPSSSSSSSPSSPASWFWEAATSLDRKSAKKWRRRNLASKMLRLFPLNLFSRLPWFRNRHLSHPSSLVIHSPDWSNLCIFPIKVMSRFALVQCCANLPIIWHLIQNIDRNTKCKTFSGKTQEKVTFKWELFLKVLRT